MVWHDTSLPLSKQPLLVNFHTMKVYSKQIQIIGTLLMVLVGALMVTRSVLAAPGISINPLGDVPVQGSGDYGNLLDTGLGTTDPVTVASQLINVFLRLLGTICVVLMVYGGWTWIWARGAEDEIQRAKDIIRGSIIGLLVVLSSFGIMQFVFYYLTKITNAVA